MNWFFNKKVTKMVYFNNFSFDMLSKLVISIGYLMNMLLKWVSSSGSFGKKSLGLVKIG
jgi:hypothetical protein